MLLTCGGALLAIGDLLQASGNTQSGRYTIMAGYAWMTAGLLGYCIDGLLSTLLAPASQKRRRGS